MLSVHKVYCSMKQLYHRKNYVAYTIPSSVADSLFITARAWVDRAAKLGWKWNVSRSKSL